LNYDNFDVYSTQYQLGIVECNYIKLFDYITFIHLIILTYLIFNICIYYMNLLFTQTYIPNITLFPYAVAYSSIINYSCLASTVLSSIVQHQAVSYRQRTSVGQFSQTACTALATLLTPTTQPAGLLPTFLCILDFIQLYFHCHKNIVSLFSMRYSQFIFIVQYIFVYLFCLRFYSCQI